MTVADLTSLCELLSRADRWELALERLRELLALPSLAFLAVPKGPSTPAGVEQTAWWQEVAWEGRRVGWFVAGQSPVDAALLAELVPLVAWARFQQVELAEAKSLVAETQRVASSALDFSEFVTWLLHAGDEREVERLGTHAVLSILKAQDGALLRKESEGWTLRLPSRDVSVHVDRCEQGVFGGLLSRVDVEVERPLDPNGEELERILCSWGFTHAFAAALDSGDETHGLLFALSTSPFTYSAEARISATQLGILVSVTLDRFGQQQRLHEHKRSLEDALRIAHMGTWELSLLTDEMTWSPQLHRLYGGPFKAITQSSAAAMSSMDLEAQLIQKGQLRDLLLTGESAAWRARVKTFDGRTIWTRSSCELLRDADGRATRVRGVTRDVTVEVSSQLERERALKRATRYERLFSMSDTIAAVCTAEGVIEEVSPSWTRQLGYQPGELCGLNIGALLHPADRGTVARLFDDRPAHGPAAGSVLRLKNRSGEWRWLQWTAASDGTHVYAAATDITSLQETSQRLEKSEAQLRQAGAIARIGAWSLDLETSALSWSDEVRSLCEVPPDYVPQRGDTERFYDPPSFAALRAASQASQASGKPFDVELEVITWTGRRIFARHQANVEMVNGRAVRLVGAFQDVTEQRMAREGAVEASRVKSQFLANTSHEIRTPLNGILGMTKLALETALTAEQREYLEAVRVSGENLLAIVNDILDISKIESGKLELERAPFSLRQAIFEAARNQASRAHARDIELVVDFAPELPEQHFGDAVRVSQVATNLIGNAVKFTEHGQVVVQVRGDGDAVELSVSDTGIGIPDDRIHRIFEAFTQADGATNRRFGGTGLGLTITLQLVKGMGGTIDVESTPGRGSCFRIRLPLEPVERAARRAFGVERGTALMVSDVEASRRATSRQLEQLGFTVVQSTGKLAMRELLELGAPPELVVIDHELEQTTGVELSEALHLEESLRVVPRLLLTRTTSRPSPEVLAAAGVRRVLSRPTSLTELLHSVQQLEKTALPSPAEERVDRPAAPQRQLKLLLAEDNAINARLAQRLCERLGHRVVHVVNGALAVSAVEREEWDAVLMDMHMPELDGLEATRRIRDTECTSGRRTLPIIALTASAMKGDDELCLAAGMDAYLTKPLDADKLASLLEALAHKKTLEGFLAERTA